MTLIEVILIAGFLAGLVAGACFGQRFGNLVSVLCAVAGAALGLGAAALFLNILSRLADICSPRERGKTVNQKKEQDSQQSVGGDSGKAAADGGPTGAPQR